MVDQIHGMVTYINKHSEERWARKCVGKKNTSGCLGVSHKKPMKMNISHSCLSVELNKTKLPC